MGTEIERKFRVIGEDWRASVASESSPRQGFLVTEPERTVRVRLTDRDAVLRIKGRSDGARRAEFEYALPPDDAAEILAALCRKPLIEKTRCRVPHAGHVWEVDFFHGDNAGLVVADDAADRAVDLPAWVDREVTDDPRYYNANLVHHPFREWYETGAV